MRVKQPLESAGAGALWVILDTHARTHTHATPPPMSAPSGPAHPPHLPSQDIKGAVSREKNY